MKQRETIHHVNKIVIFTLDTLYSAVALHYLVKSFDNQVVLIVESQRYGGKYGSFFHQFKKNLKKSGFRFVNYLSHHFIYYKAFLPISDLINKFLKRNKRVFSLKQLSREYFIPVIKTKDPNEKKIIRKIRNINPDLIITAYFDHVIKKELINIPKFGIINVHTALLPDYRGPFPSLWPIIKGEKNIGVTIHYINNEKLDVGPIIAQEKHKVIPNESVLATDCRLFKHGIKMVENIIVDIENGNVHAINQENLGSGSYLGFPKKEDLKNFKKPLVKISDFVKQFI